jgi:hypothetical protein
MIAFEIDWVPTTGKGVNAVMCEIDWTPTKRCDHQWTGKRSDHQWTGKRYDHQWTGK